MKLTPLLIGMTILSGVVMGLVGFYGDVVSTYAPANSTTTAEWDDFNSTFSDYMDTMGDIENKSVGVATKEYSDLSKYEDLALVSFGVLGVILQLPNLMITFVNQGIAMVDGYIPTWLGAVLVGIIVTVGIMRIASLLLKTDEI